jgi:flagellar hook assembly protein FlgD
MQRRLHIIGYLFVILLFINLSPEVLAQKSGLGQEAIATTDLKNAIAFPNPFTEEVTIEYHLKRNGPVEIQVNNMLGQMIRSLVKEHQQAGLKRVVWDGMDGSNGSVHTGMYYIILRTETDKTVIKVMKTN